MSGGWGFWSFKVGKAFMSASKLWRSAGVLLVAPAMHAGIVAAHEVLLRCREWWQLSAVVVCR